MASSAPAPTQGPPLAALRRFARKRIVRGERCELCGSVILADHQHLLEPANRRLLCACDACSILFSDQRALKYRRVPRRIEVLRDFHMSDLQWESLHLPIYLAFFYMHSPTKRVIAMYPSPAGATESLLDLESWTDLAAGNPVLHDLEPDVEALLVNRVGQTREYCRVPIDECFRLVGLIRTHWRGLSGGTAVWREINEFFASLRARSVPTGGDRA